MWRTTHRRCELSSWRRVLVVSIVAEIVLLRRRDAWPVRGGRLRSRLCRALPFELQVMLRVEAESGGIPAAAYPAIWRIPETSGASRALTESRPRDNEDEGFPHRNGSCPPIAGPGVMITRTHRHSRGSILQPV